MRTAVVVIGGIFAILLTFTPLAPLGMMLIYGVFWNKRREIEDWRHDTRHTEEYNRIQKEIDEKIARAKAEQAKKEG